MALINTAERKHIPASARTAALITAGLWGVAVLLFTGQAQGDIALSDGVVQIVVYWLLGLGCTMFWCAFMRVGEGLVDADWHIAYELDPEAILALGRDRDLDRILAHGLAVDRPPDFWPTGTWRIFAKIGSAFWVVSALVTIDLVTRWWPVGWHHRGILLLLLMSPAVQCTAASLIGPGLTRMLELREAAREGRRRLCAEISRPEVQAAMRSPSMIEDLRDTALIPAHAMRALGSGAKDRSLRIIKEDPGPHRGLYN